MAKNPHYLSQIAHVELLSTNLDETVRFYTEMVGMDETARDENSSYLRAWKDYFLYTLKITQSDKKGLGTIGWRADSEEALADNQSTNNRSTNQPITNQPITNHEINYF